jgi:hypothetical protein
MKTYRLIAAVLSIASCIGCASRDGGYTLPAGNAERGKEAFVRFRCFDCHGVEGVNLPPGEEPNQVIVKLGGEVTREKTYADLVTGIVNPSHRLATGYDPTLVARDGKSRMTVYNDVMTVTELIDLVTFLQERYELRPHEPTVYPEYPLLQ